MTSQNLASALLESDEFDAKDYLVDPPRPKEVEIYAREWWRRSAGGTYYKVYVNVDGRQVYRSGLMSGHGDQYIYDGWGWLEENGFVPAWDRRTELPREAAGKLGIKLITHKSEVRRQRDT